MGIFDFFFKSKAAGEEPPTVERKISLDKPLNWIWVKIQGRELSPREFLESCRKGDEQSFGRFYLTHDDPAKTHFAPSLKQAISWFRGESAPNDGYGTISWGDNLDYACNMCNMKKQFQLTISKIEKLVLNINIPEYREMIGWRVIEVSNEVLGRGMPTKFIRLNHTVPVIKWYADKNKYSCRQCAERLAELGREQELADYVIFETD